MKAGREDFTVIEVGGKYGNTLTEIYEWIATQKKICINFIVVRMNEDLYDRNYHYANERKYMDKVRTSQAMYQQACSRGTKYVGVRYFPLEKRRI